MGGGVVSGGHTVLKRRGGPPYPEPAVELLGGFEVDRHRTAALVGDAEVDAEPAEVEGLRLPPLRGAHDALGEEAVIDDVRSHGVELPLVLVQGEAARGGVEGEEATLPRVEAGGTTADFTPAVEDGGAGRQGLGLLVGVEIGSLAQEEGEVVGVGGGFTLGGGRLEVER